VSVVTWTPRVVEVTGQFGSASNITLLGLTEDGTKVVYKPVAGERPLWDFPPETLASREVLTYLVSEILSAGLVPETVVADGPYGKGAVQRYLEPDRTFDSIDLVRVGSPSLWPIALLDVVCNNADRKLGHILASKGRLFAIDHGLTFHPADKLRTVLWGFGGKRFPSDLVDALALLRERVIGELGGAVAEALGPGEATALLDRVTALLADPTHPAPPEDRPPVPWPPY